jgi:hypothetical protein
VVCVRVRACACVCAWVCVCGGARACASAHEREIARALAGVGVWFFFLPPNIHIMTMKAFYLCFEFTMSDFEFPFLTSFSACRLMIVSLCCGSDYFFI